MIAAALLSCWLTAEDKTTRALGAGLLPGKATAEPYFRSNSINRYQIMPSNFIEG
jgi:hypothetical protein